MLALIQPVYQLNMETLVLSCNRNFQSRPVECLRCETVGLASGNSWKDQGYHKSGHAFNIVRARQILAEKAD